MQSPDEVTLPRGSGRKSLSQVLCPRPWKSSGELLRTPGAAGKLCWKDKSASVNFRSKSWAAGQKNYAGSGGDPATLTSDKSPVVETPRTECTLKVKGEPRDKNQRNISSKHSCCNSSHTVVKGEKNFLDRRNISESKLEEPTKSKLIFRRRKSSPQIKLKNFESSSEEETASGSQKQTPLWARTRSRGRRPLSLAAGLNSPVLQRKLHKAITRRSNSDNNIQRRTRKIRVEGYTYKLTMEPPGLNQSTDDEVESEVASSADSRLPLQRDIRFDAGRSASVPETEIRKHATKVRAESSLSQKEMKQAQKWVSDRENLARSINLAKPVRLSPAEEENKAGNGTTDESSVVLPNVDSREALDCAALRLRRITQELDTGNLSTQVLKETMQYAISVLEMKFLNRTSYSDDDSDADASLQGDSVVPPEIKRWLMQTFSTSGIDGKAKRKGERRTLRSVVHVMQAGMFVERMFRKSSAAANFDISQEIHNHLRDIDKWNYDIFELEAISNANALKYTFYEVLSKYDFIRKYKISGKSLFAFCDRLQIGYRKHNNQYHNPIHAADVTQCVSVFLNESGFVNYLSELEVFAMIFAAAIHDLEHTGTTNNFHTQTRSSLALLYNDKSVLENHHASAAFRILWEDPECDILSSLSKDDYKLFRELVIDMVLATDMSLHFGQVKNMKSMLQHPEKMERSKAMSLMMHCADISNATRPWEQHHRWTARLMEEFFQQGDKERELQLPLSPLVDRHSTMIAQSQIGFIDYVISPTFDVLNELFWKVSVSVTEEPPSGDEKENGPNMGRPNTASAKESSTHSPRRYSEASPPNQQTAAKASLKSKIKAFRYTISYCLKRNRQKWVEKDIEEQRAKRSEQKRAGQSSSSDNGASTT